MTTATLFVDLPLEKEYLDYIKSNPDCDEGFSDEAWEKAYKKWKKGFKSLAFEHACYWVKKYMGNKWVVTTANFEDESLRMDIELKQ